MPHQYPTGGFWHGRGGAGGGGHGSRPRPPTPRTGRRGVCGAIILSAGYTWKGGGDQIFGPPGHQPRGPAAREAMVGRSGAHTVRKLGQGATALIQYVIKTRGPVGRFAVLGSARKRESPPRGVDRGVVEGFVSGRDFTCGTGVLVLFFFMGDAWGGEAVPIKTNTAVTTPRRLPRSTLGKGPRQGT